ncbi:MAG: ATP-binding protein, partial [Chitinophagales bacterium]
LTSVYTEIGNHYYQEKAYQKALDFYQLSLKTAKKTNNSVKIGGNLYKIGRIYLYLQNNGAAIEAFLEAYDLELVKTKSNFPYIGKLANYISKTYKEIGNLELAYQYRLKALQVFEELKDSTNIAISKFEMGNIFFFQDQYTTAIQYYEKSKQMASHLEVVGLVMASIGSIGSAYDRLGQVEKSLEYNLLSLKIAEENKLERQQADALHNVASNYHVLGYCNEALEYYQKSLDYKLQHDNKFGEAGTLRAIGGVYLDLENSSKGIYYLNEALAVAEEINSDTRRMDVYQRLASAYEQSKMPAQACKYMKAYMGLKDSVLNQNTLETMAQVKTRYEVEKREKEISFLKNKNEVLEKDREIAGLRSMALIGLVLGLFLLLLIGTVSYNNQKRYNNLLEEKTQQIALQNTELEIVNQRLEAVNQSQKSFNDVLAAKTKQIELQNKQLENTNEELKQFAYVASHDLKEPLRMISSYTSLIQRRYTKNLDAGAQEFMSYITDATHRMTHLLDDLLAYSRISTNNKNRDQINLKEVIEGVLANLHLTIQQKGAKIHIDDLPRINANRSQIGQLYQNLISNALKFSDNEHPQIDICVQKNNTKYIFSVKDNGIGISPEHQQKIFDMFSRLHTRQEYEGTGIGLATCKKIIERHEGIIWVESEKGKGCTFFFVIPSDNIITKTSTHSSSSKNLPQTNTIIIP